MNTITFLTPNYVARQLGYNMTGGWGQGDKATSEYFKPVQTFGERLGGILTDIQDMGFDAVDLWTAHLSPTWATDDHVRIACQALEQHKMKLVSLAGGFGSTPEEFEKSCKLAVALNTKILAGSTSMLEKDRPFVASTLQKYGLKLGLENHPEKTPEDLLKKIGDGGNGTIGVTVDTGWFGTQGYDAAEAIGKLRDYLFHVHLKDVLAAGAHDTCRYGQGVVPIERCVRTLEWIGYQGAIGIEHEPEHYDPTEDIKADLSMLRSWLKSS